MHRLVLAAAILLPSASTAVENLVVASELATIIGSEHGCDISINTAALAAYIDERASENDMQFASALNLLVAGTGEEVRTMSAANLAAHCHQVGRSAKAAGLLSE